MKQLHGANGQKKLILRDALLLGTGSSLVPIPRPIWRRMISHRGQNTSHALAFMTPEHHRVRNFVVLELPRVGRSLAPEVIAGRLGMSTARVVEILDELERHMTFVFRDAAGAVVWAYPVTVAQTPHHLTFNTGERLDAA